MQQPESTSYRVWLAVGLGVLGVCLVATPMFLADDPAHILLTRLIQILMTVSGSICVLLAVILYFLRDSTDLHQ